MPRRLYLHRRFAMDATSSHSIGAGQERHNTRSCPECNHSIPVEHGFVTWCHHCNWNVAPLELAKPETKFQAMYMEMGKRAGGKLFDSLRVASSLKSRMTPSKLGAFAIASVVHGFSLLLAALGIGVVLQANRYGINACVSIIGLAMLATAWVLRPTITKLPKEDLASRKDFPELFKVTAEVCKALNAKPIDMIVLESRFNAAFTRAGWSRKNVLYLGLPLFSVLKPQERIALLGHEIGHSVNGDATRSFFVGSAVRTLVKWYVMLEPGRILGSGGAHVSPMQIMSNVVLKALVQAPKLLLFVLVHLLFHDMQRAEYLADYLGSEAASTEAGLSLLRKLHLHDTIQITTRRFYLNNLKGDLFEEFRRQIDRVPARELERVNRAERMLASRLDATHPPTAYRIDMLEAHPVTQPSVTLSEESSALIDKELSAVAPAFQARLLGQ